jgi:hypothetical protein
MDKNKNINLEQGVKITINGDPNRVISFDPTEITFAEKFYKLQGDFAKKQAEYLRRATSLDAEKDRNGFPVSIGDTLAFLREVCEYLRAQIDYLFGSGTSQTVFGDALSLDSISEFLNAITPYIQATRSEKMAKYAPPPAGKKRRNVMKGG